jgi:hypothetical protein
MLGNAPRIWAAIHIVAPAQDENMVAENVKSSISLGLLVDTISKMADNVCSTMI